MGKKSDDGEVYNRNERISNALNKKYSGKDTIPKLEYILNNDIENDTLSKGIIEKNWKIETCHDYLTIWESIDKEKKYEYYDRQTKITVFNSYGLPYLDEFYYYNELGYLVERVQRLKMTSAVLTEKYGYNEKGNIASIKTYQFDPEIPAEETLYFYDQNSNLLEKHFYRNGVFKTEIEMIYNDKSKLLSYVLTRDVATQFIMILGFKNYVFY